MVALMNNTKWFAVMRAVAATEVQVRFQFVGQPEFWHPPARIRLGMFGPKGFRDGRFCPFEYRELQCMWAPRVVTKTEQRNGKDYRSHSVPQPLNAVMAQLEGLGGLPIDDAEGGIYLYGYADSVLAGRLARLV
jgi:hypothetical protein